MSGLAKGEAAAILRANINTDIIAPAVREGHADPFGTAGQRVFGPWRYLPEGGENPDFVLNRAPFRNAVVLIAGENFACGSSRETAASWLRAFGMRCVIAPSFGGIFHDNCFRHGILPLALDAALVAQLAELAGVGAFTLDFEGGEVRPPVGAPVRFSLPAFRRAMLVDGADEIAVTLERTDDIDRAQARLRQTMPWIWPDRDVPLA